MTDFITSLAASTSTSIPAVLYHLATRGKEFLDYNSPSIPVEDVFRMANKDPKTLKKGLPSFKDALFGIPTEKAVEIREGKVSLNGLRHLVGAGSGKKARILGSLLTTVPLGTGIYASSEKGIKDPEKTGIIAGSIAGTSGLLGRLLINKENAKLDKKTADLFVNSKYDLAKAYNTFYKEAGKITAKKKLGLALAVAGVSASPYVAAKTRKYLDDKNKTFIERLFS